MKLRHRLRLWWNRRKRGTVLCSDCGGRLLRLDGERTVCAECGSAELERTREPRHIEPGNGSP